MDIPRPFGRKIGILLLVQMVLGLILPFILLRPPFVNFPDYLTTFSGNASQVRAAVFIGIIGSALTVAIGIAMWPVLSQYSQRLGIALVTVCSISCTLDLVQDAGVMSMLSLSERVAASGGADAAVYQITGSVVAAARRWAHYVQLIGFAAWMLTFYFATMRTRLLPSALSLLGIAAVMSQFIGVTLMAFLGMSQQPLMAMALGVIHLTAGLWLIAKGFNAVNTAGTGEPAAI